MVHEVCNTVGDSFSGPVVRNDSPLDLKTRIVKV